MKNDGLVPNIGCDFGDIYLIMNYDHNGYLSSYWVYGNTYIYRYNYTIMDSKLILDSIQSSDPDSGISYDRDINNYWYRKDSSGNKTPCDRPEEADSCPPLPMR